MKKNERPQLSEISDYYTSKVEEHGATPNGVDWNGEESQTLRFEQLLKIVEPNEPFTINDLGCGYGALYEHLDPLPVQFSYCGVDISESMIATANERIKETEKARFIVMRNG